MTVSEFIGYLKTLFAQVKFYNGTINKDERCVGVYLRSGPTKPLAIGGKNNTSYSILPLSMLVHWSENANETEQQANSIHSALWGLSNFVIGSRRIIQVDMLDPGPVDISRDEKGIAEMVIRLNIYYER